jgi:serine/threonine protein kinase
MHSKDSHSSNQQLPKDEMPINIISKIDMPLKHTLSYVEYRLIRKLGEGTFSEVLKAQSVQTG